MEDDDDAAVEDDEEDEEEEEEEAEEEEEEEDREEEPSFVNISVTVLEFDAVTTNIRSTLFFFPPPLASASRALSLPSTFPIAVPQQATRNS